jgi:putative FmdB family regulatory protein
MPTYTYGCEACQRELEVEQRISDPPLKKCPKCGKLKLRRLIAGGNFILKGGGWYSDGYGSSKKGGDGSGGASSGSAGDSTPSAPSTPPTKTDAAPSSS